MIATLPKQYLEFKKEELGDYPDNSNAALLMSLMSFNQSSDDKDGEILKPVNGLEGFYFAPLNVKLFLDAIIKEQFPEFFTRHDRTNGEFPTYTHPEVNCKCKLEEHDDRHELGAYGVCDSPEQFAEHFKDALTKDPRKLIVTFWEVRREDQSEDGGWRYHKWGQYIGSQKPENEYLYDDKHIEKVYCWHIYEIA